jgi:hypothetical protein
VLPLHALPFGFWFILMNPDFVTSDEVIQEVIILAVVLFQKTGANVQAVASMIFCQMFGHPTCGNFVGSKNVRH